jgi:adenylate kinase family enzyme
MKKIAIVGSPGAGKTTLAKELGPKLKISVFHMDRIFWQYDWKERPRDTRIDIIENLVQEKQWIIDGTYLNTSELHLETADTIIFLGISPLLCLWRIIKRHQEYERCSRRDLPIGSTDKLTLFLMLKVLFFPVQGSRTIKQKLRNYQSKQIIRLHSTSDVEYFIARLEPPVNGKRQFLRRFLLHEKIFDHSEAINQHLPTTISTRTI